MTTYRVTYCGELLFTVLAPSLDAARRAFFNPYGLYEVRT